MLTNRLILRINGFSENGIIALDTNSNQHLIDPSVCSGMELRVGDRWLADEYGSKRYLLYRKIDTTATSMTQFSMLIPFDVMKTAKNSDLVSDIKASGVDSVFCVVGANKELLWSTDIAERYSLTCTEKMIDLSHRLVEAGITFNPLISFDLWDGGKYCQNREDGTVSNYCGFDAVEPLNSIVNDIAEKFFGYFGFIGLYDVKYDGDNSALFNSFLPQYDFGKDELVADYISIICDNVGATVCFVSSDVLSSDNPSQLGYSLNAKTQNTVITSSIAESSPINHLTGADVPIVLASNSNSSMVGITDYNKIPLVTSMGVKNVFCFYENYRYLNKDEKSDFNKLLANNRVTHFGGSRVVGIYTDRLEPQLNDIRDIVASLKSSNSVDIKIMSDITDISGVDVLVLYDLKNITKDEANYLIDMCNSGLLKLVILGETGYNISVEHSGEDSIMINNPFATLFGLSTAGNDTVTYQSAWSVEGTMFGNITATSTKIYGVNSGDTKQQPIFLSENKSYVPVALSKNQPIRQILIAVYVESIIGVV